jgi:thioredoxin-related protein
MKNNILLTFILILIYSLNVSAQDVKIYNPDADAKAEIAAAVEKASLEGKHVFLQIGGNWCPWCVKFHGFVDADNEIKTYVDKNYIVVKVNYDPKNRNEDLLASLGYPQRFGFPVFVILDSKGNRIHTQNSAFLEKDKGYDKDRVLQFFKHWSPAAINPDSYKK